MKTKNEIQIKINDLNNENQKLKSSFPESYAMQLAYDMRRDNISHEVHSLNWFLTEEESRVKAELATLKVREEKLIELLKNPSSLAGQYAIERNLSNTKAQIRQFEWVLKV